MYVIDVGSFYARGVANDKGDKVRVVSPLP
jgi:hypothetical protein